MRICSADYPLKKNIRVIAFDLDGTLTPPDSPIEDENLTLLSSLAKHYRLLVLSAGKCRRIHAQLRCFPMEMLGSYGMEYARPQNGSYQVLKNTRAVCDRELQLSRIEALRRRFSLTVYAGASAEFHDSGCFVFPLLGTDAPLSRKLSFDPDRSLRRHMLPAVVEAFPDYHVFLGGTSSFDITPVDKHDALCSFCAENGYAHHQVLFVGDDYGPGGNDACVEASDFPFLPVDSPRALPAQLQFLL